MQLKIVFNNDAIRPDLFGGWGFACLVDNRILFDTGEDSDHLAHNLAAMDIDPRQIEAVILSHDHWDHTGGLAAILDRTRPVPVYACCELSRETRHTIRQRGGELIELEDWLDLDQNLFLTGALAGIHQNNIIQEQALVIRTGKGLSIITGCAHPGIVKIIEVVKMRFDDQPLQAVLGGFHLHAASDGAIHRIVRRFKELGVSAAGPAHCSGRSAQKIFQDSYDAHYLSIGAGTIVEV